MIGLAATEAWAIRGPPLLLLSKLAVAAFRAVPSIGKAALWASFAVTKLSLLQLLSLAHLCFYFLRVARFSSSFL